MSSINFCNVQEGDASPSRFKVVAVLPVAAAVMAFVALMASAFAPAVSGQSAIVVRSSGGSDVLEPPPSPECDDLVFVTEVSFDELGNPIDIPRFGTIGDMVLSYDVPDFQVEAGVVELNEVITYDGHFGRKDLAAQTEEQVRFQFFLDGELQVETPLTPDVPDGQRTGWIDVDMGTYELPNGADLLRIVHSGDTSSANSVVVSAICGRLVPPPETTLPPTTVAPVPTTIEPAPTTVAPETSVPPETTIAPAPSSTDAPLVPESTTVAPAPSSTDAPQLPAPTTTQPVLAITGNESGNASAVAGIFIALGLAAVLVAARRIG